MTADEIARVLVKGLIWRNTESTDQRHEAIIFEAMYEVSFDGEDWSFWNDGDEGYGPFPTLAAAQAAAEADYRARIAAALNLDLVAQLVEALGAIENNRTKVVRVHDARAIAANALAAFREAP